jgi:hypothetical protein
LAAGNNQKKSFPVKVKRQIRYKTKLFSPLRIPEKHAHYLDKRKKVKPIE